MFFVYYEHVETGKQEYCGQYETKKEAVQRAAFLYALDASRKQAREYYYFIKKH